MSMISLLAALGGGAFGAAIGALPAFILTGVVAVVGTGITIAGGTDFLTGNIAFGSFLGPHISFAGAVAATAFAARKNNALASGQVGSDGDVAVASPGGITNGADILYSLNGTGDSSVLLMGALFGAIGYLVNYLYANVLALSTDTVAMTVATLAIIVRLGIGKTGLTGKYTGTEPREYFATGNGLVYNIVIGAAVGIVVSYSAEILRGAGVPQEALAAGFPAFCFGLSALSLIFAQTGSQSPTTHHISLPCANAAVLSMNPIIGIVVAIICSLLGDFFTKTFNSHCDSHIDPPACTIFIVTFVVFALFM